MAIIKRKTGYGVRVYRDGKQHWVGTCDTLREARAVEAEHQLSRRIGKGTLTVEQWTKRWLREYPRPARSTQQTYKGALGKFLSLHGQDKLNEIDRSTAVSTSHEIGSHARRVVCAMYNDAVDAGIVDHNPFINIRMPQSRGRKDLTPPTREEIYSLAETAREVLPTMGETIATLIIVGAFTGLRPGELCALNWAEVDVAGQNITVRHTLDAFGDLKPPKNNKVRKVILPAEAVEALDRLPRWLDRPQVFSAPMGSRLRKGSLQYYWRQLRAASQVKITPHVLRHFCATYLLENGAKMGLQDYEVALQLGHQDGGKLIRELYAHPSKDKALDRVRLAYELAREPVEAEEGTVSNG